VSSFIRKKLKQLLHFKKHARFNKFYLKLLHESIHFQT